MGFDNTAIERFWSKVNKLGPNDCWEWQARLNNSGYGLFSLSKPTKTVTAHRFSYLLEHGEIQSGLCVCHACDNRKCVNPNHLWLGTNYDNTLDCINKGRAHIPTSPLLRGSDSWSSKLSHSQRAEIAQSIVNGSNDLRKLASIYGVSYSTIRRIRCATLLNQQ